MEVSVKKPSKRRKSSKKRKSTRSTREPARAPRSRSDVVVSRTPSSSPQEAPELITPISAPETEEQYQDRFSEREFVVAQENSASSMSSGDLTCPLQELSLSQYAPRSTTDNGGQRTRDEVQIAQQDVYMEMETVTEARDFGFIPRGPYAAYPIPEAEQMDNQTRMNQSLWPPQAPSTVDNSYPPPAVNSVNQGYLNQPQWSYPSPQTIIQSPFQLSPVVNGNADLSGFQPPLPSHSPLPNLAAPPNFPDSIEAYDSSNRFPAPHINQDHHGLPNADFQPYPMGPNYFHSR